MKNILGFAAGALLLLAAGCSKDDTDSMGAGTFEIAEEYLTYNFTQDQEIVFIPVRSNIPADEWKLTSSDDAWCKISRSYNNQTGLMLAVLASEEPDVRSARVSVSPAATTIRSRCSSWATAPQSSWPTRRLGPKAARWS